MTAEERIQLMLGRQLTRIAVLEAELEKADEKLKKLSQERVSSEDASMKSDSQE